GERPLCLSLGRESRFVADQIALIELLRPWVIALMKKRIHFEDAVKEEAKPIAAAEVEVQPWRGLISQLTARESAVIRLMLDGYSHNEIADRLTLSIATIKVHRRHIYAKLSLQYNSEIFALLINQSAPRLAVAR
ncbi:response regulator transcription factor, partial [Pseudomonas aeruginosa]